MANETIDQEVQRLLSSEKVDYVPPNCEAYQWKPAKRHRYMPQYVLVRPSALPRNPQIFGVELPEEDLLRLYKWISRKISSMNEEELSKGGEGISLLFNGPFCLQHYLCLRDYKYGPAYASEDETKSSKYVFGIWTDLAEDSLSPRECQIKALELLTRRKVRWWVAEDPMGAYEYTPGDRYCH